jgi:hypothetical protein
LRAAYLGTLLAAADLSKERVLLTRRHVQQKIHPLPEHVLRVRAVLEKTWNLIGVKKNRSNNVRQLRLPELLKSFAYLRQRVSSPDQHNYHHNAKGNS